MIERKNNKRCTFLLKILKMKFEKKNLKIYHLLLKKL